MRVLGEEALARKPVALEVVSLDGSWHHREIRKENLGMPEKEAMAAPAASAAASTGSGAAAGLAEQLA